MKARVVEVRSADHDALKNSPENPLFQRLDVDDDIRQLRHFR